MPTYVLGDIQGCFKPLIRLLDTLEFDPAKDKLWLVGDLVNRGPDSLSVLRFVRDLGDSATCVLGNHDLHLLAVYTGHRKLGAKDTVQDVLDAPDAGELIEWLRNRPLLVHEPDGPHVLCHAGLHPAWDLETAEAEARFVEQFLQSPDYQSLFSFMYGNKPAKWKSGRSAEKRIRFAVNCFTRMRFCKANGKLDFQHKGAPGTQSENLVPWYTLSDRKNRDLKILFGHWSTLGETNNPNVIGLDSGCVWGGCLTAYELESGKFRRIKCETAQFPARYT